MIVYINYRLLEVVNEGSKLEEITDSIMHLVTGKSALDVGTGFGTVISKLLVREGMKVTSIDPEAWTFDRIEEEFREQISDGRLRIMKARAEDMPFEREMFDTTMAICSLHHLKYPSEGIREMERVSRERVLITDWDPTSSGVHNPHSEDELQKVKDEIRRHADENGYTFSEMGKWYLAWK